jgi:hypothetical protein
MEYSNRSPIMVALIVGPTCLIVGMLIGISFNQLAIARAGERAEARAKEAEQKLEQKTAEWDEVKRYHERLLQACNDDAKNLEIARRQLSDALTRINRMDNEIVLLREARDKLLKEKTNPPADDRRP